MQDVVPISEEEMGRTNDAVEEEGVISFEKRLAALPVPESVEEGVVERSELVVDDPVMAEEVDVVLAEDKSSSSSTVSEAFEETATGEEGEAKDVVIEEEVSTVEVEGEQEEDSVSKKEVIESIAA